MKIDKFNSVTAEREDWLQLSILSVKIYLIIL